MIPSKFSDAQYASSVELTQQLRHHITDQQEILNIDDTITRAAKQKLRAEKLGAEADAATAYCESLTDGIKKRTFEAIGEKGASAWLTSLPLAKYGFTWTRALSETRYAYDMIYPFRSYQLHVFVGQLYRGSCHVIRQRRVCNHPS